MADNCIAFIGLGTMGLPMALNLVRGGFGVQGYDLNPQALATLAEHGGQACDTLAQACQGADVIITMLPREEHVRAVLLGNDGVREHARPGALVVDMSTISVMGSQDMAAQLAQVGIGMMDVPVGRTPADAQAGTLLALAAGTPEQLERVRPALNCMADQVLHLGPQGNGVRMKIINNFMSMVGMVMTAETLALAEASGIDPLIATQVLQNTTAGRGQINVNYPRKVLDGDISPDFPIHLGLKDISLGVQLGRELGVPLFVGQASQALFQSAQNLGLAKADCTALLLAVQQLAGRPPLVPLPKETP